MYSRVSVFTDYIVNEPVPGKFTKSRHRELKGGGSSKDQDILFEVNGHIEKLTPEEEYVLLRERFDTICAPMLHYDIVTDNPKPGYNFHGTFSYGKVKIRIYSRKTKAVATAVAIH